MRRGSALAKWVLRILAKILQIVGLLVKTA